MVDASDQAMSGGEVGESPEQTAAQPAEETVMAPRPVLGVDLGTSSVCLAVWGEDGPLILRDGRGQRLMPAVVGLGPREEFVAGELAKSQKVSKPALTVRSVKRLLGYPHDDPAFLSQMSRQGCASEAGVDDWPMCVLGSRKVSPGTLLGMILSKAREIAEEATGETLTEVVLTVPSYFTARQRQEVLLAAKHAAFDVLRLVSAPTAAAIGYGQARETQERVLVFDFGGGGCDVAVLRIGGDICEVLASRGSSHLSGDELTWRLAEDLRAGFEDETGIDLTGEVAARQRLFDAAEKAKIALSRNDSAEVHLLRLVPGVDHTKHLQREVKRQQLELLVAEVVEGAVTLCREALSEAGLKPSELDQVLLVGGQTRMPCVVDALTELFGREPHNSLHPHHICAEGALRYGRSLQQASLGERPGLLVLESSSVAVHLESGPRDALPLRRQVVDVGARLPQRFVSTCRAEDQLTLFEGEEVFGAGVPEPGGEPEGDVEVEVYLDMNGLLSMSSRRAGEESWQTLIAADLVSDAPSGLMALPSNRHVEVSRAVGEDSGELIREGGTGDWQAQTGEKSLLSAGAIVAERYVVGRAIGKGSFGAVYTATDRETGDTVAIKTLIPEALDADKAAVERFKREGEVLSKLKHPNLIATYAFGQMASGAFYMVMEYVDGMSLLELFNAEGRLEAERAIDLISQALEGLSEAHRQGIVHRDLKPDNIMFYKDSAGRERLKLLDFGVAKMMNAHKNMEELTMAGTVLGTPRYIAPEQLSMGAKIRPVNDVYSMGLIFYQMVTGQRAIKGEAVHEILTAHLSPEPVVSRDDPLVPGCLFHVMRKSTEKDNKFRYQSVDDFLRGLREVDREKLAGWQRSSEAMALTPELLQLSQEETMIHAPIPKNVKEAMVREPVAGPAPVEDATVVKPRGLFDRLFNK